MHFRVQALVAIGRQRWAEAHDSLEEALQVARSMRYPYAEARLLHVYGVLHLQQGGPQSAQQQLTAALAIFRRLGAHKDIEQSEQLLAMHLH